MMLKARYVVPIDAPAIENGAVIVERGRITAVGTAREVHGTPVTDYGDAVICPGFVNAHTHLELSLLAGRVPPDLRPPQVPDFVDWLRRLVAAVSAGLHTREQTLESVRNGIAQSLSAGVTLVGDIARTPQWTRGVLASSLLRGVSFGEVIAIGSRRHLLAERLDLAASTQWESEPGKPACRWRVGISPHSPYTVEPDAMRACADRARADNVAICVHVAETAEEERFTRDLAGAFTGYLRELGVWDGAIKAAGCGPVELLHAAGLLGRRTVLAHANYVTDEDIGRIAASGSGVAFCPRTHRAFQHPPHRFREMLSAGINVCLGTDSLASSPTLSILDELRFLRREHPDMSADDIIRLGTLHGARALGFDKTAGSLTPGKTADLVVVPLDESAGRCGAWGSMLDSTQPPTAVYIEGTLLSEPRP